MVTHIRDHVSQLWNNHVVNIEVDISPTINVPVNGINLDDFFNDPETYFTWQTAEIQIPNFEAFMLLDDLEKDRYLRYLENIP